MIGKVTRGRDLGGLLRYLYGPGRANEHTRPHLVASWRGDDVPSLADLEPACRAGRPDVADLTARLLLPVQLHPDADRPVWQCSMRTAPGDRTLTDAEWASIARDVVHRTGFAPHGDDAACRWIAVRHADDHIHIAVVLARMDGHPVEVFRDWPKVHAAARVAERRLGLRIITTPSRTASRAPTRAELAKATRTANPETARRWLTRQVRDAASRAGAGAEFAEQLARRGVLVTWRESQRTPGHVTGYAVGRPGDLDAAGRQVWFGGSKLAGDLSLPRLQAQWATGPRSPEMAAEASRGRETVAARRLAAGDRPAIGALWRTMSRVAAQVPMGRRPSSEVAYDLAAIANAVLRARLPRSPSRRRSGQGRERHW